MTRVQSGAPRHHTRNSSAPTAATHPTAKAMAAILAVRGLEPNHRRQLTLRVITNVTTAPTKKYFRLSPR